MADAVTIATMMSMTAGDGRLGGRGPKTEYQRRHTEAAKELERDASFANSKEDDDEDQEKLRAEYES